MHCFVQFSKAQYTLTSIKNTHLKKFSPKRNWEQMKKLDLFCKKLSASQVNFQVKHRKIK